MHQLAREFYASSTSPLVVKLLAYINGINTEYFTGIPSCGGEGSHVITIRPAGGLSPPLPSYTGICIILQVCYNHHVISVISIV